MTAGAPTSRFGCLGCAWLGAMLLGTAVMVGALVWIEPQWLQPALIWREPPLPPETVMIPVDRLSGEAPEPTPDAEDTIELWEELAVVGTYDPAAGLTLRTIDGSEVVLPPGSVDGARPVTLTPVARVPIEMTDGGAIPVGPVLDLTVDGEAHWSFGRPLRVSLPFKRSLLPDGFPDGEPTVAVWEEDRWATLPTNHDLAAGVVTAEVPHASVIAVVYSIGKISLAVAAGWSAYTSETSQAFIKLMTEKVDRTYRTKNFAIHYISAGTDIDAAPPPDAEYTAATTYSGTKDPSHPRYITDLGVFLEEGRSWLPEIHLEVAEPWVTRWDVFAVQLNGSFGESGLGGPVLIDNDLRSRRTDPLPANLEYEMRRTAVHELIHVAQDAHLSNLGVSWYGRKWWMESTAEYLSVRLTTRKMGISDPKPYYYIEDNVACPAIGWDAGATTADRTRYPNKNWPMHWYSYARLMDWMASKGLDVPLALSKIGEAGAFTEKEIDAKLRAMPPGLGLVEYHATFARELYHANLWTRSITGGGAVGTVLIQQRNRGFTDLARRVGPASEIVAYAETELKDHPVVSSLYPFHAFTLPPEREARLVVQVEAPPGANDTWVFAAGLRGNPPYRGKPTPFLTYQPRPLSTIVSTERVSAPRTRKTLNDFDRMSVIVTHGSFAVGDAPIAIRRWLLMAPAWVRFVRLDDGAYAVSWHQAELATASDGAAFKGYHLYRRRYGERDFPSDPLNVRPMTGEYHVDRPPSEGFWEYTVRVRDIADNLSEPAPLDADGDPFAGTWEGKMRLLHGSIAELATRALRAEIAKAGPQAGGGGAEALIAGVRGSFAAIDLLFRLGIPVTFEVQPERGGYILRVVEVLGSPVDDGDELELDRLGRHTIGKLPTTPQGSPVLLSLTAKDRLKRRFSDTLDDPDIGRMRFTLQVDFTRTSSIAPAPTS